MSRTCILFMTIVVLMVKPVLAQEQNVRPNIVWLMLKDWSTDLSCYGTKGINNPFTDKLASEGIRYTNAFCTSPVCSPSRSAMMTGFHQNYIGAEQHRLKNEEKKPLPYGIKPMPLLLQEADYYKALIKSGKTDCNFEADLGFMGTDWKDRKKALIMELNKWRKSINDAGISQEFREGGLSSKYPTRTLDEWKVRYESWKPWVFRKTD